MINNGLYLEVGKVQCDECDDDPLVIQGFTMEGELLFGKCCHDYSDMQNDIDDVIDTCTDMLDHKQAQD